MSRGLPVEVLDHAAEALFAPHFAELDRPRSGGWLPPRRCGELQGRMQSLSVVVVGVFGQQVVQVARTENHEMVEALDRGCRSDSGKLSHAA